jgi:hypothetical protein
VSVCLSVDRSVTAGPSRTVRDITQGTVIRPTEIERHTDCILAHHCTYQTARCVHTWHISLQQEVTTNFPRPTESDNQMIPIVSASPPPPLAITFRFPSSPSCPTIFLYLTFFVSPFLSASLVFHFFLPALFSFMLLSASLFFPSFSFVIYFLHVFLY